MQWLPIIVAPFIGSFLGVLIRRLPAGEPVAMARSACAACGRRLGARDLVPLVSFLLLRGRCRICGAPIGWFHPAIELAALGVALWAALTQDAPGLVWASCVLGWTLLALGWIDVEHGVAARVLCHRTGRAAQVPFGALIALALWLTWLYGRLLN
jgi:leader peptidase (prepilin peptidase)/N-methyltransferase